MIGFSRGFFIVISTHVKEIGNVRCCLRFRFCSLTDILVLDELDYCYYYYYYYYISPNAVVLLGF